MTIFEYLMVMVSIILALALAQLLRGVTEIVTNPNRYWIHSYIFGFLLSQIIVRMQLGAFAGIES